MQDLLPSEITNHQPYRQRHIATQNIRESTESTFAYLKDLAICIIRIVTEQKGKGEKGNQACRRGQDNQGDSQGGAHFTKIYWGDYKQSYR